MVQELEQLGKDKGANQANKFDDTAKMPLVDAAKDLDGLSPASQRTNDPGLVPDSQGDKTAD